MHLITGFITGLFLVSVGVEGSPIRERNVVRKGVNSFTWKPTAFAPASPNTATSNVFELRKLQNTKRTNPRSAAYLKHRTPTSSGSSSLLSLEEGEEFATSITVGTQTFEVIVDTGSSDTWLIETGFECVEVGTTTEQPESECAFGAPYILDSAFKEIPDEIFNITYGDGETVAGVFGTAKVTLAGITVDQTIALGNFAGWFGDGTTSGLTGLAYPALTSAFSNQTGNQIVYNPIFTTMYKEGLISPLFSLAILRDVSGPAGYIALGGLPPISFNPTFTSTPILITTIDGFPQTHDFYTINIDGVTINGKTNSRAGGSIQYIVDSGTTLNYYPTDIANAVNAAFDPPAQFSEVDGAYLVDCNAKPPNHGITIGGTAFNINPLDMILLAGTDGNGNDVCISGIDDGGSNLQADVFILGDAFQKNVVTVFDVGAVELRFAANEFYPSNDNF